jgi:GT2 family glycosyltransferase
MPGARRRALLSALDAASARRDGLRVEGAAMFRRREMLYLLGGIEPVYFVYGEEDDLQHRAKNHGIWMGFKTAARVAVNACSPRGTVDRPVPFEARLRPLRAGQARRRMERGG